jgi:hypothetical protein
MYTCRPDEVITHQVLDLKSGKVYLGCTNKLYQLNSNLEFELDSETGPVEESDNENKALLILNEEDSLITCGTSYKGTCEMRSLSNISIATAYSGRADQRIFYGSQRQSFAFVAPAGPFGNDNGPSQMAMYVGTLSKEDPTPPLISTRMLEGSKHNRFKVYVTFRERTSVYFNADYDKDFNIEYVSGFSHEGFSYFLTVQSVDKVTYESRIIRICQKDSRYGSYIELPIKCSVGTRNYDFVRDAFVTESGSNLAKSMNISTNESILYAVFTDKLLPGSSLTSDQSAVCIYSLQDIRHTLYNATKSCWIEGRGTNVKHVRDFQKQGSQHFKDGKQCNKITVSRVYLQCTNKKHRNCRYSLNNITKFYGLYMYIWQRYTI